MSLDGNSVYCYWTGTVGDIREIHRAQMLRDDSVRQQDELDQTIEHLCPTLFFEYRSELRSWFAILERKKYHYERYKQVADTIDPRSKEESDWYSIYARLREGLSNELPKWSEHVRELGSVTTEFFESAQRDTRLTNVELNFLLHQYWKHNINEPYSDSLHSMVLEYFIEALGRYRQEYPKLKSSLGATAV
jgi:hypothetical protein